MQGLKQHFLSTMSEPANFTNYPWRKTHNPYHLLIAELLLQRTNAKQVISIYNEFIIKYPTIYDVHIATEEDIHNIIKSLGLFKKVKYIKKIAEIIVKDYNGIIPNKKKELLKLPSIGEYTASAILVHSFKQKHITYDNNVARLLDRYFGLNLKKPLQKDKSGYNYAIRLLDDIDVDDICSFNLNMIDYGKNICKINNLLCEVCVLNPRCLYNKTKNKIKQ